MLTLVLDTSTAIVAVGVADGEGREVLSEISVSNPGASDSLLPAIHAALELSGRTLGDVECILVGVGPGTFTGIRIAAATARSLALGAGASLSKNSTLAALAAPALSSRTDILAVLDAKRRQIFAQRFSEGSAGEVVCVEPEGLSAPGAPLVVGDGAVRYREILSKLGEVPPDGSPLHRVSAAGHVMSADFAPVPAEDVAPIYVREPDAEVRRDLNPWSRP
ncbi:MAG: tRNA (adenosine(37)-N6)-threonylcarbamoyltransferase complex dimerization subunit type 1 TsaB [Rubrobacter sp.]|jgi:tRNA threonylcarbamoyl adenosine modification protein YeaZ|nr:tRNA (adenosine(37)-N6)-threonylcarbamoyltransferase complex dimerization subunit type 1 TsaB [Rubrobacter sp.]